MVSDFEASMKDIDVNRLNPCFNGIWSRTSVRVGDTVEVTQVLILVLMEYGLGHRPKTSHNPQLSLS